MLRIHLENTTKTAGHWAASSETETPTSATDGSQSPTEAKGP